MASGLSGFRGLLKAFQWFRRIFGRFKGRFVYFRGFMDVTWDYRGRGFSGSVSIRRFQRAVCALNRVPLRGEPLETACYVAQCGKLALGICWEN